MEAFTSFIALWPLDWAPRGWALCWGAILSVSQNSALFSLIGSTYGGDGRTKFALPDFRGRVPVGYGYGVGLIPYPVLGGKGGAEGVALNVSQLPAHSHSAGLSSLAVSFKASDQFGTESAPGVNDAKTLGGTKAGFQGGDKLYNAEQPSVSLDGVSVSSGSVVVQNTGSDKAHENRQPYLVTNYIMCMDGLYPSRQ